MKRAVRRLKQRRRDITGANRRRRNARQNVLMMMPKGSRGAEVGVAVGNFSARILRVVEPAELHLIDPWSFDESLKKSGFGGGRKALSQADMDATFAGVGQRFQEEIEEGIVYLHRSTSDEAVGDFSDDYLDWVYIDGNHLYEFVRRDLSNYLPKVKRGGYIGGDDYGTRGWWKDGVTKAVDEFNASDKAELVLLEEDQFVFRRP